MTVTHTYLYSSITPDDEQKWCPQDLIGSDKRSVRYFFSGKNTPVGSFRILYPKIRVRFFPPEESRPGTQSLWIFFAINQTIRQFFLSLKITPAGTHSLLDLFGLDEKIRPFFAGKPRPGAGQRRRGLARQLAHSYRGHHGVHLVDHVRIFHHAFLD